MVALGSNPAFGCLMALLRMEYKDLEKELFMPVGDKAGTYAKEFITGKVHGLKMLEYRLTESRTKLQENIKAARQS